MFLAWLYLEIETAVKQGPRTYRAPNLLFHGFLVPLFKLKGMSQRTKEQRSTLRMRDIVGYLKVYEVVVAQKWDWIAGIADDDDG